MGLVPCSLNNIFRIVRPLVSDEIFTGLLSACLIAVKRLLDRA